MNNTPHARLHELFDQDPLEDTTTNTAGTGPTESTAVTSAPDDLDRMIDDALAATALSALSPEAQELLVGLTETSSSLEPEARRQLVAAADRGMKRRRDDASPLPRLLFILRTQEGQSLDAVAASLLADETKLGMVERGELSVDKLGAKGTARWIRHFNLPTDTALDALTLTFQRANANQAAAGSPVELSPEHDQFVADVADHLRDGT